MAQLKSWVPILSLMISFFAVSVSGLSYTISRKSYSLNEPRVSIFPEEVKLAGLEDCCIVWTVRFRVINLRDNAVILSHFSTGDAAGFSRGTIDLDNHYSAGPIANPITIPPKEDYEISAIFQMGVGGRADKIYRNIVAERLKNFSFTQEAPVSEEQTLQVVGALLQTLNIEHPSEGANSAPKIYTTEGDCQADMWERPTICPSLSLFTPEGTKFTSYPISANVGFGGFTIGGGRDWGWLAHKQEELKPEADK